MKTCFKCKKEKELTEFYVHPRMADGHLNKCKDCTKKDGIEHRKANINKVRAYDKKRSNLPHRVKLRKLYAKEHIEQKKVTDKAYYIKHRAEIRARMNANKEEISITRRAYRQNNAEKIRIDNRKRIALKRGVRHEAYKGNYIFERDGWVCGICGRKINKRLKHPNPLSKSIDHIVPLSKGGDDSPENVQAAHLRCNIGKHARNIGQLRMFG